MSCAVHVSAGRVRAAVERLLAERSLSPEDARDVADVLVESSLQGIDTHGLRLLPAYLRELDGGRANAHPQFRTSGPFPAARLFDADHALGIVAACAAMREAIAIARENGVAAVAVANSNHFGAAGHYARMAAQAGQIGIVCTNSDALVAPYGGSEPLNGTNPLAIAAPGDGDEAFALDMATSETSFTSALHALWERDGRPETTGATNFETMARTHAVVLQPLGGHKGQGLGTAIQILCALLTGMPADRELHNMYRPPYDAPRRISHFMIAIRIDAFPGASAFRTRLSALLEDFRRSTPQAGGVVAATGDRERAVRAERIAAGIPLDAPEIELLQPYWNE